jgi:hypothetical protein
MIGRCTRITTRPIHPRSWWLGHMQKKNIGDHRLGIIGYEGKEAVWKKEDE